jgi:hypothetical protein
MAFGEVCCISADHCEKGVGLKLLSLIDINFDLHWGFSGVVDKTLNLDVFFGIDGLKELKRLNGPSHQCKGIVPLKRAKTMPVADKTGDHIHDLKKSSNPDVLFVIANEGVSELAILGYVEVDGNVRVLEMVFLGVMDKDFFVLLDFNLWLENVGGDEIFEIDGWADQPSGFMIVDKLLFVLLAEEPAFVELLLQELCEVEYRFGADETTQRQHSVMAVERAGFCEHC